ncbi:restriction endonuclease subunit S [Saccharopolyspora phatthalungensis]|uniref:Type I restriction enzyme S subunit n=1 Tax=Saccharopolyspora phatthalungensis TaxID=664693 RepID=A0A840QF27_9PSEU|nr:restriction endonuclease subunit S [Saccharopolyspora phatthalungensis]MBB5155673.1 type I restriction enzyme S subunit [Saccharopolyspora phatthalungensis]
MSDLPNGWAWATLGEIADVRLGRQRSPKNHTGNQMRPYLRAANIGWEGLKLDDVKQMNFTDDEVAVYCLRPGDILLSEASGSASEVGKPAIWKGEIEECCFQNTLIRVRSEHIDSRFLMWFLKGEAVRGAFVQHSRGVGIHHIGVARLAKWSVPIPPLAEQRRIVAALEDHLSRVEAGARLQEGAEVRARSLVKRILVEAVPASIPDHWRQVAVGDAGTVDLGRQRHPDWHSGPNMRPYLRVANVFEDRIDTSDVMEMHFQDDTFERFRLQAGDILLNEGQSPELLGRPAMYRGKPEQVAFTNSLLRFKCGSGIDPEWALLVFRRHVHSGRYLRDMRITTNIAHLSSGRFKKVEFPIPPLQEQKQIVRRVHESLQGVDRLATEVLRMNSRAEHLRRSLLREAFAGRLVAQNPGDEPASVLMERIRAERGSAPKVKRERKARAKAAAPEPEIAADRPLPEPVGRGTQDALDLGL